MEKSYEGKFWSLLDYMKLWLSVGYKMVNDLVGEVIALMGKCSKS